MFGDILVKSKAVSRFHGSLNQCFSTISPWTSAVCSSFFVIMSDAVARYFTSPWYSSDSPESIFSVFRLIK